MNHLSHNHIRMLSSLEMWLSVISVLRHARYSPINHRTLRTLVDKAKRNNLVVQKAQRTSICRHLLLKQLRIKRKSCNKRGRIIIVIRPRILVRKESRFQTINLRMLTINAPRWCRYLRTQTHQVLVVIKQRNRRSTIEDSDVRIQSK